MKVINISDAPKEELNTPLFTGTVSKRSPVKESTTHSVDYISFGKGVRNKLHSHSSDQVLIVTKGKGIVATETEKVDLKEGDIVLSPAGEKHWHGAAPESEMTHISITAAGSIIKQLED